MVISRQGVGSSGLNCLPRMHESNAAAAFIAALPVVNTRCLPAFHVKAARQLPRPAQVSGLLRQADTALASCRRWLPNATLSVLKHDLASTWRSVKATAAQYPGQDRLPLPVIDDEAAPSVLGRLCAGCGRGSVHLQACSACRSAHYCRQARCVVGVWAVVLLGGWAAAEHEPCASDSAHHPSPPLLLLQPRVPDAALEARRAQAGVRGAGGSAEARRRPACAASVMLGRAGSAAAALSPVTQ